MMLNRQKLYHILGAACFAVILAFSAGCTKSDEQQAEEEKGRIEKMTDRAAETAVKKIRTPQDKARATQGLGDDRLEEMDKAVQQQ